MLQDDVSTTADVLAGVDTEEQTNANQNEGSVQRGMQEEEQEVNIDNFMYNRTGTNTMEEGSPAAKMDGEGSDSRGGRAVGKEMWDEGMEERRLCFGCNVQKGRSAFSTLQWQKADGWTRETARRCQSCLSTGAGGSALRDTTGDAPRSAAGSRSLRKRVQRAQMAEDTCEMRSLEQVLCPSSCRCRNALPREAGTRCREAQTAASRACVVGGEGVSGSMLGVVATDAIAEGEIITCFGSSATVMDGGEGRELTRIMAQLSEQPEGGCQYTCSHNLGGEGFAAMRVWVIPPQDVELLLRESISESLRGALARRGPAGIGHFVNHTCCARHRNAELAVRWVSEARRHATVAVIATKQIQPGERVLVHYAPEGQDFERWKGTFKCECCKCRGVCGGDRASGPGELFEAMQRAGALQGANETGLTQERTAEVGTRVRVQLPGGTLVGNITQHRDSKVRVWGRQGRALQPVSVMVDPKNCEIIPDNMLWGDLTIPAWALQRVKYRQAAPDQQSYLDDTVLTALLRWGLHGDSASAGLQPSIHRDWIGDTYTFEYMQRMWREIQGHAGQDQADPMGSMLHAASQPDAQGAASRRAHKQSRWLQLDLNMYDNIMLPINLPQHWLLAWIDAKSRRLHLLDCSKEYGKGWRGTIHGLLWIWLVASVRRRNATTGAAATEPIWSIDLRTVDVHDLSLLPGFTREARDRILRCRRDTTETLSTVKSVLGASNIIKLTNLNIELRWGGPGDPRHWQWSSKPLAVPQQTRKCDCAIFTFLYSAFVTRGWDLSQLRAFDPQAARAWIQQVLLREGKWARQWACCACGVEIQRAAPAVGDAHRTHAPECSGLEKSACRTRQAKLTQARGGASPALEDDMVASRSDTCDPRAKAPAVSTRMQKQVSASMERCNTPQGVGKGSGNGGKHQTAGACSQSEIQHGPSGQTGEGASSNPPAVQPRREGSASAHDIGCKGLMGSRARGATKSSSKHPTARHQGKDKKKPSSKCVKGRRCPTQRSIVEAFAGQRQKSPQNRNSPPMGQCDTPMRMEGDTQSGPIRKAVLGIKVKADGTCAPGIRCVACGKWNATCRAGEDPLSFVCDTKCWRRWWQQGVVRTPGGNGKRTRKPECTDQDEATPSPSPPDMACTGCGKRKGAHPCERCWGVWYCTQACQRDHWVAHQSRCTQGPWCVTCGSEDQQVWCNGCNKAAYCSRECRGADRNCHQARCDGRWEEDSANEIGDSTTAGKEKGARGDGFVGSQGMGQESKVRAARHQRLRPQERELEASPGEEVASDAQGRHKDALVRMVEERRRSDVMEATSNSDAAARTAERLQVDQAALQCALEKLNGPAWTPPTDMSLQNDRRWARTMLRPLLKTMASRRVDRLLTEWGQDRALDIVVHGIPADSAVQAVNLLSSAGLKVISRRECPRAFQIHTTRESAWRRTTLRVTVEVNDALRHTWSGRQRVGGNEVICERADRGQEEDEEWHRTAVLRPPHAYASDLLQQWCRAWRLVGLSELEMREIIIWSTQNSMPEWRIDELLVWSPGPPRLLHQVWAGTGAMQGQIRLRGEHIAAQHRNSHLLRNAHAVGGRRVFETRCPNSDHHLPRGTMRRQSMVQIQIGLPRNAPPVHSAPDPLKSEESVLTNAPIWEQTGQLRAMWEPMIPGSDWEAMSTVCIRFKQIRSLGNENEEAMSRRQVRQRLVCMLNEIQKVCRLDNRPFEDSDVCYAAVTSACGNMDGLIALQKRDRTLMEDDTLVGAVLGFYIGNDVRTPTTSRHKWCPISGRMGETACGVSSITAAHTWGGGMRRQLRMGTQRAGEPTWRIRDPKEGTVRRILALVGGRGDKVALLARLRTTPWTRKKTVMARGEPTRTHVDEAATGTSRPAWPPMPMNPDSNAESEHDVRRRWCWALEDWEQEWVQSLSSRMGDAGHQQQRGCRSMKKVWLGMQGDRAGVRAVTGDWVPRIGVGREMARVGTQMHLQEAIRSGTFETFMQELKEQGHVGVANEGLRIWEDIRRPTLGVDQNDLRDRTRAWRGWLDWEVQMARPQLQANVTTWNVGPLGYEASKEQLRRTLGEGRAVLMIQELCFPLGAQRRVKRELNDLHPDYICLLETGKESLTDDCWDTTAYGWRSPWHLRKHFAVASFFHKGVFKSVQRLEWDTEGSTRKLRHMTRGRVLWAEAITHGGKKLRTFNIHQATSSHLDLQNRVWQILKKHILDSKHHMMLLGGDLNANAGGVREGYAVSTEHRMRQVDTLLADLVRETGGRMISPATMSWKQDGGCKGARLDHVVCWNMAVHESGAPVGREWRQAGNLAPEGAQELTHQKLQLILEQYTKAGRLAEQAEREDAQELTPQQAQWVRERSISLSQDDWARLDMETISPQCAIRVGESFFQPAVYGRADWTGAPQHDHAKVSVSIARDVLKFEREQQATHQRARRRRPRLDDWKKIAPDLNATLQARVLTRQTAIREGKIDTGEAVQQTMKERVQLEEQLLAPVVKARSHQQRRGPHRNHEQIALMRDIARAETALREGPQGDRITAAQGLCLRDLDFSALGQLSRQEELAVTASAHWKSLLEERVRVSKEALCSLTQQQVHESRREMDRRARRAFENEHKGPSKFTGKQGSSHQPELLRWAVPVGLQWVSKGGTQEVTEAQDRAREIRRRHPDATVTVESGEVCVAVVQVGEQEMERALLRVQEACATWAARYAEHNPSDFIAEVREVVKARNLDAKSVVDLQALASESAQRVTRKALQHVGDASIGTAGLRGGNELRWTSSGPHACEDMELWLEHLTGSDSEPAPFHLEWDEDGLSITHPLTDGRAERDERAAECAAGAVATPGMKSQGCAVDNSRTQRARRTLRKSETRAGDTPFGLITVLKDGPPTVPGSNHEGIVVLTATVQDLARVDELIQESRTWGTEHLVSRQILLHEGPWKDQNMAIAWELYFQAQGLAPHAWCGTSGCARRQPLVIATQPLADDGRASHTQSASQGQDRSEPRRRQLAGFCAHCWQRVGLRTGREDVASIDFMKSKRVFTKANKIDPKARLRGPVTENEFQKFVDNYLKNNKAPGPDGVTNECVKTMSKGELDILRTWANEILAHGKTRLMTVEEMNGTISLLHKGGDSDDRPRDWRPVVLLNCTNQLVMHILNARLREIVERAGILEPGQAGGRQGRSTDINLAKLEWVTREALSQGKIVYRIDVDFTNAFNAMSQAALWQVMEAYGIPDVDLLKGLYDNSTVRLSPNDASSATIVFDTGVAQGSALSPLLFLIFMNALLGLLTETGKELNISHGLESNRARRRQGQGVRAGAGVGQFNSIGFVDDLSLFAQSRSGAQALLNAVQMFEEWSGLRVNQKKTCAMIIGRADLQGQDGEPLSYHGRPISMLPSSSPVRYLGLWGTACGDMEETKRRILEKTRNARDMIEHHPLTPEQAVELFVSVGVGAFRYSAALVSWTAAELGELEKLWVQAYKRAWLLPLSTASDIFTLPQEEGGLGYPRPLGIMAQELCRHLQRSIKHDDVARQISQWELDQTLERWACASLHDLQQEMKLWKWDQTLGTKWARVAKCMQLLNMEIAWHPTVTERSETGGTSWAEATRELRRLRSRIEAMGGCRSSWEEGIWHMEKEQWRLVWDGEAAFWEMAPKLLAAGHTCVEDMVQCAYANGGETKKIPLLARVKAEEGTQTVRILVERGLTDDTERTRHTVQRWLDMVDWRAVSVGKTTARLKQSVKWYLKRDAGQVRASHPARTWVEGQEARMAAGASTNEDLDARKCSELLRKALQAGQGEEGANTQREESKVVAAINPGCRPDIATKGVLRLVRMASVNKAETITLMKLVRPWLPPGWGAGWQELVAEAVKSEPSMHAKLISDFIDERCTTCPCCQTRFTARCRGCAMRWCTRCTTEEKGCEGCDGKASRVPEAGMAEVVVQAGLKNKKLANGTRAVNVHNLGSQFVSEVLDVRRTPEVNQRAGKEGETLQFLAQVRGWQGVEASARKERLLNLNDLNLGIELEREAGTDIFLIPKEHYPQAMPDNDDSGWWYRVREVRRCRQCTVCGRRKVQGEFTSDDWSKQHPAKCRQCKGDKPHSMISEPGRRKHKLAIGVSRAGHSRCQQHPAAHGAEGAEGAESVAYRRSKRMRIQKREDLMDRDDSASEADVQDDERELYGVWTCALMSPADPRFIGRGDDSSGGEVAYTLEEMRTLLQSQPGEMSIWLTTRQMGWSLSPEYSEIWNARDEMEGKPTARGLAPAISTYIRGLSEEIISSADQDRQAIFMEARLLDQAWGIWDDEEAASEDRQMRMPEMPEGNDDIRHHVEAIITRHRREWEPPSHPLVQNDPQLLPDGGLTPQIGCDFFLDERIPRDARGQGYVAVTETSLLWKECATADVFTYQGLTSCLEPDQTWTVMGSVWHSLRRRTERSEEDLRALIHGEAAYQDKLEAAGYRSPSWRILRALQGLQAANQLQGESAVSAPPFFRSAGRGQTSFWGKPSGPTVFLWESLDEEGKRACEEAVRSRKDWVVWSRTRPKQKGEQAQAHAVAGKAVFAGKVRSAQGDQQIEGADELSDGELEEEQTGDEARKGGTCRRRGWWKAGNIATSACPAGMTAWVHKECTTIDQRAIMNLRQAWDCAEEKDECTVSMTGLERDYWLGSEAGRVGSYEFQGAVFGIDGSNHEGCMGSGCCRLGMPEADQRVRVGREEEGTSSNRPELGGVVLALKQAELSEDVLILCDNESVLKVIKKWIGQGGRATLADAPDADILREILELLRARIEAGRATFFVKVKSHRGEPMNERADTLAEEGRARPDEEKRWDARTDRMTFTITRQGTSKTSVWTDSVRNAFRKQAGRSKTQDMYEQAARNWSRRVWYPRDQRWMQATKEGRRAAKSGKFKDEQAWGKECFEDLERRDLGKPATTTWTTDFLVRGGESREELGKWLRNRAVPWKRRRRLIQVVTDTFPCGQWLHKIGRRSTAECELCRRIKEMTDGNTQGDVPVESIGHIQSAGCLGQSEVVTTAHNECIRGLIGDLQMHRKKRSNLTFLTMESEHTINTLWEQDGCSEICSKEELWEAAKEVEMSIPLGDSDDVPPEWQYEERFWRRRLDGIALDTVKKRCYLLEFKRTRDRRLSYEEKAAAVAIKQYRSLMSGLKAIGPQQGWKVEQLVFVGGTCGSVNEETFNTNLELLDIPAGKRNHLRQRMARRLLEVQDTVLRAYFAQKYGEKPTRGGEEGSTARPGGLAHLGADVYA